MSASQTKASKIFSEHSKVQSIVSQVSELSQVSKVSNVRQITGAPASPVSRTGKRYWLIRGKANPYDSHPTRALAVGEKLAVFSFREEAESFLDTRAEGHGWRIEKLSTGELVASLCGPLSAFESVALDPIPETGDESGLDGLLQVGRKEFIWRICEADL